MPRRRPLPTEAIPALTLECQGGPRDGERVTVHGLRPFYVGGQLAGYVGQDEPLPTDAGAYVVTRALRLEWEPRGPEHDP